MYQHLRTHLIMDFTILGEIHRCMMRLSSNVFSHKINNWRMVWNVGTMKWSIKLENVEHCRGEPEQADAACLLPN